MIVTITPDEVARLQTQANRYHPDHMEWGTHEYMFDCPWCRSDEPERIGGAHSNALRLIARIHELEEELRLATEATVLRMEALERAEVAAAQRQVAHEGASKDA